MHRALISIITILTLGVCFIISYFNKVTPEGTHTINSPTFIKTPSDVDELSKIISQIRELASQELFAKAQSRQLNRTFLTNLNKIRSEYKLANITKSNATAQELANQSKEEIIQQLKISIDEQVAHKANEQISKLLIKHQTQLADVKSLLSSKRNIFKQQVVSMLGLVKLTVNDKEIWVSRHPISCSSYKMVTGLEKPEHYLDPNIPLDENDRQLAQNTYTRTLEQNMENVNSLKLEHEKKIAIYNRKVLQIQSRIAAAQRVTGPNKTAAQKSIPGLRRQINKLTRPTLGRDYTNALANATSLAKKARSTKEQELLDKKNAQFKAFPRELANSTSERDVSLYIMELNKLTEGYWEFKLPSIEMAGIIASNQKIQQPLNEYLENDDGNVNKLQIVKGRSLFPELTTAGFRIIMNEKQ